MNEHRDMHKPGVYGVKAPSGEILFDTFANTGYSARAEFVNRYNKRWSVAEAAGYTLAEFTQSAVVLTTRDPIAVKVPQTSDEWSLYGGKAAEEAAQALGKLLREKLAAVLPLQSTGACMQKVAEAIRDEMYDAMDTYCNEGACDSEPEAILVQTIEKALGLGYGELTR